MLIVTRNIFWIALKMMLLVVQQFSYLENGMQFDLLVWMYDNVRIDDYIES